MTNKNGFINRILVVWIIATGTLGKPMRDEPGKNCINIGKEVLQSSLKL